MPHDDNVTKETHVPVGILDVIGNRQLLRHSRLACFHPIGLHEVHGCLDGVKPLDTLMIAHHGPLSSTALPTHPQDSMLHSCAQASQLLALSACRTLCSRCDHGDDEDL